MLFPSSRPHPAGPARSPSTLAWAIVLGAGLAGCATTAEITAPHIPATTASQTARNQVLGQHPELSEAPLPAQWWALWNDPILASLQSEAVLANLDLQLASARLAQSQAELGVVNTAQAPQVGLDAGYSRSQISKDSPLAKLGAYPEAFDTWNLGLQASWELDLWGYQRHQSESAQARQVAAEADLAAGQVSLSAELARTYWLLRGVQAQQDFLAQQISLSAQQLALSESRQRNGVASDNDVTAARAALANLQAQAPNIERQKDALINSLTLLLGQAPHSLDSILTPTAQPRALPQPTQTLAIGVSSELAHQRPDIVRAEARLRAAVADIGVAQADFYPRISLGAGMGRQSFTFNGLADGDSRQFNIGPSVHLPMFEAGRLRQTLALTQARQREAAIQYQSTILRAWHEVDDALSTYRTESDRQTKLRDVLAQQGTALTLAERAQAEGVGDQSGVIAARQKLLGSEAALTESQTASALAIVALYRALGGGWSGTLQTALAPTAERQP